MLKPDLEAADRFLSRFNYGNTTLQLLPDKKTDTFSGPVANFYGYLSEQKEKLKTIQIKQNNGYGVFFMVNEGTGLIPDGKKTSRCEESVTLIKSLFIDTDGQPLAPLDAFLSKHNLIPHAVYESSPGRFHYYLLLESLDYPDPAAKHKWQSLQITLAKTGGYDESMKDVSRLLRVPGFYHLKDKPFQVRLVSESNHDKYDLHELFDDLKQAECLSSTRYIEPLPDMPIKAGQRHAEVNAYLGHISNDEGIKDLLENSPLEAESTLLTLALGHIIKFKSDWENYEQWLPSGTRHEELKAQVSSIFKKRIAEIHKNTPQQNGHIHTAPIIPNDDKPSASSSSIFLESPGLIGAVARDFAARSKGAIPEFEYAAARQVIGLLKSFTYMTDTKTPLPPVDYLMCLAPTGRGKAFSKDLMQEILVKLGFGQNVAQKIRSAQGLDRALFESNGRLLIVHNEAHHFMQAVRSSTSDYMKAVIPWFLDAYDIYKQAIATTGLTGDSRVKSYDHAYSQVGYLGYGVPVALEELFNAQSLHEGTMGRFLVFNVDSVPIRPLEEGDAIAPTPVESLQSYALLKDLAIESGELERKQLADTYQIDPNDDDETSERKAKTYQREQKILELNSKSRKVVKVPYAPDAFNELRSFHASITKLRDTSPELNGFYARAVEHVERAALCDAHRLIEKKHVEHAIASVMACLNKLRHDIGTSLDVGSYGRLRNKVLKYLKIAHEKTKENIISENEIMMKLDSSERQAAQDAIKSAAEEGFLLITQDPFKNRDAGKRGRRIKRGLTLVGFN